MASMRHNRKRKRGRRRFGLLFKLLCGAALVAAATLGATVFFQVETASGVQIGDNLFQMNKNQISQQILQRLPYVGEVSPQRGLPSTLTIQVTEISAAAQVEVYRDDSAQAEPAAADGSGDGGEADSSAQGDSSQAEGEEVPALAGQPWLISASGKLLEAAPEGSGVLSVTGLTVLAPQAGTMLAVPQEQQSRLATLKERGAPGAAVPAGHAEGAALRPGGGWGAGSGLLH